MKKKLSFLVLFLTITSLISLGLSSWTIDEISKNSNLTIEAGELSDYGVFTFDKMVPFKFNKYGILSDETYQQKGEINVQFKVKSKNGLDSIYKSEAFDFYFKLTSKNSINLFNFLDNVNPCSYVASYSGYENHSNPDYSGNCKVILEGSSLSSNIYFTETLEKITSQEFLFFVLTLNFDFTSVFGNFESEIYEKLNSDNLIFLDFEIGVR